MKKKLFVAVGLSAIIAGSVAFGAYAASDIKLFINGKKIETDLQIVDGSSYVPLRVVSESLGAEVVWDNNTRTIDIKGYVPQLPKDGVYKTDTLAFYDVQVRKGSIGWEVGAEVKNIGEKTLRGATFTAVFYDASGTRLGKAVGSTSDLAVSSVKTESLITTDDLTGWKTMKFQQDMAY